MTQKERKIKQLKVKLIRSISEEILLPGGISRHLNVCGKAGCRCKDPERPVKHGPYYQLSFTVDGRSSSFFVKEKDLPQARRYIDGYREFQKLWTQLIRSYIKTIRKQGFTRS